MDFEKIIADLQAFFADLLSGNLDLDAIIAKLEELFAPIIDAITGLLG